MSDFTFISTICPSRPSLSWSSIGFAWITCGLARELINQGKWPNALQTIWATRQWNERLDGGKHLSAPCKKLQKPADCTDDANSIWTDGGDTVFEREIRLNQRQQFHFSSFSLLAMVVLIVLPFRKTLLLVIGIICWEAIAVAARGQHRGRQFNRESFRWSVLEQLINWSKFQEGNQLYLPENPSVCRWAPTI